MQVAVSDTSLFTCMNTERCGCRQVRRCCSLKRSVWVMQRILQLQAIREWRLFGRKVSLLWERLSCDCTSSDILVGGRTNHTTERYRNASSTLPHVISYSCVQSRSAGANPLPPRPLSDLIVPDELEDTLVCSHIYVYSHLMGSRIGCLSVSVGCTFLFK